MSTPSRPAFSFASSSSMRLVPEDVHLPGPVVEVADLLQRFVADHLPLFQGDGQAGHHLPDASSGNPGRPARRPLCTWIPTRPWPVRKPPGFPGLLVLVGGSAALISVMVQNISNLRRRTCRVGRDNGEPSFPRNRAISTHRKPSILPGWLSYFSQNSSARARYSTLNLLQPLHSLGHPALGGATHPLQHKSKVLSFRNRRASLTLRLKAWRHSAG